MKQGLEKKRRSTSLVSQLGLGVPDKRQKGANAEGKVPKKKGATSMRQLAGP